MPLSTIDLLPSFADAVSYTHLDVYKRQVSVRGRALERALQVGNKNKNSGEEEDIEQNL